MSLWKRGREIEQLVEQYLVLAEKCLTAFSAAFDVYFSEGLSTRFETLAQETAQAESGADNKRREVEEAMYGRALIPESRGDVLGMLESIDLVPNKAESVLWQIWLQSMILPAAYVEKMKDLVRANCEAFELLCRATRATFDNVSAAPRITTEISRKEGESDSIERELIKSAFDASEEELPTAQKILLKELILEIGSISDRAENAADRLRIIAIKRKA